MRRDGRLIAKINKLEKELLVSSKECVVLDDTLKSTKSKVSSSTKTAKDSIFFKCSDDKNLN